MNKIILPNIASLIEYAVQETEKTELKDKKQHALNIVKIFIDNLEPSDNKNFLIDSYLNNNISDLIDMVISASKGELKINNMTIKRLMNNLCKCLLFFLNKNKKVSK